MDEWPAARGKDRQVCRIRRRIRGKVERGEADRDEARRVRLVRAKMHFQKGNCDWKLRGVESTGGKTIWACCGERKNEALQKGCKVLILQ